jgi:patatin-like phospholipase/acyl hydrolase
MDKIYTLIPTSSNIQPKKESIDKIKAFAASYRVKETDQQIIFEGYLN